MNMAGVRVYCIRSNIVIINQKIALILVRREKALVRD
jgi:hypothetical protein